MATATLPPPAERFDSPMHQQVARVRRRLFLQTLVDGLVWCWIGALALAVVWFLLEPFLFALASAEPPAYLRWVVAGSALGLGTLLAVWWAVWRAPRPVDAALSLDQRFGLRERVTTSLLLTAEQYDEPAAQALLLDVDQHVAGLDVATRFPIRLSQPALAVPGLALALLLLALFYDVRLTANADSGNPGPVRLPPQLAADIDNRMQDLKKDPEPKRDEPGLEQVQPFDDELDRIANKPHNTPDELRDRFGEIDRQEKRMEAVQQQLQDKVDARKEELGRLADRDPKEGPAKDLQEALAKGEFDKAREKANEIAPKLENDNKPEGQKLNPEEKKQLEGQLKELKDKLEAMAQQKEEEKQLRESNAKGELSKEALEQALAELDKKKEDLEALNELAKELQKAAECMQKGQCDKAGQCLKQAGDKMGQMAGEEKALKQLAAKLEKAQAAKKALCNGLDGKQGGGLPGDRRPEKENKTDSVKTRVAGEVDPKGQKQLAGTGPIGRSFKPKSTEEMAREMRESPQLAPEALERQRLPNPLLRDVVKGYRENASKPDKPE
jgi:hypothetical protein